VKVAAAVLLLSTIAVSRSAAARIASTLEYTVAEELPTGSVVGDVKRDLDLKSEYGENELSRLRFQLRRLSDESNALFSVDERSGVITTARRIDRDQMCHAPTHCDVTIDITVSPTNYFRLIRVVVHVADLNDNR